MATDPGKMDRRITIRTEGAPVPDGGGGWTPGTPTTLDTWALVEPLQGDEQLQAMQTGMVRPHRFTIPYRDDMAATKSIIYRGRTFDVKSIVDPEEQHDELVILADEITV